ncbi:hypothetical protein V6N11_077781 [Hibiscus sabdariffa]|uniref:Uncharacterized protein n=1 Tax=Hibiscus sabdariffa TaxID=183260 RepID=A0ABR2TEN6_9ROSI
MYHNDNIDEVIMLDASHGRIKVGASEHGRTSPIRRAKIWVLGIKLEPDGTEAQYEHWFQELSWMRDQIANVYPPNPLCPIPSATAPS